MFKEKISKFFESKLKGNNKKNIENLIMFLVLLVITIIAINIIWKEDKTTEKTNTTYKQLAMETRTEGTTESTSNTLTKELENILEKISGVGKVKVLITYAESSEIVAMYNESYSTSNTEETDTNGGIREIEETDMTKEIIKDASDSPVTQKIVNPKIEGAIVTAQGAGNINVKTNIINAVSAVTGLATYKIQVFEMGE